MTNKEMQKEIKNLNEKIDKLIEQKDQVTLSNGRKDESFPWSVEQPKEEFETNNWYILDDKQLVFFTKIEGNDGFGFGFITCSTWIDENDCSWDLKDLVVRKATPQEVGEALKNECIKLGIVKGTRVKSVTSGVNRSIDSKKLEYYEDYPECGEVVFANGTAVYNKGKFAEIIEDSFEILGHEVKVNKTTVEIGCTGVFNIDDIIALHSLCEVMKIKYVSHEDQQGNVRISELKELIDYINK